MNPSPPPPEGLREKIARVIYDAAPMSRPMDMAYADIAAEQLLSLLPEAQEIEKLKAERDEKEKALALAGETLMRLDRTNADLSARLAQLEAENEGMREKTFAILADLVKPLLVKEWSALDAAAEAIGSLVEAETERLRELLREGVESAWCDAVIGCLPHVEPKRAAKFRDHFYDWRRRARAALSRAQAKDPSHE